MEAELLSTIAKREITESDLIKAIAKLQMPPDESLGYWSRIANDPGYRRFHRRRAAVQLFRRHVHVGMRLSDVAQLLNRPNWLHASDIDVVKYILGKIPVHTKTGDTVFYLLILPQPRRATAAVYLRVAGKVDVQSFRSLVLGLAEPRIGNATVEEIGISEP